MAFNAVTPVYDSTMVDAPMTAWADLWRDDLAGKIAWPTYPGAQGTSALLMAARINGGSEFDIDPGFEAIAELKPFAAFQSSQAQLYGMFDADQVAASAEFGSFTQKYADTQNADIVVAKPSEGMPVAMNVACITEGTENQALAEAWVSLHLSEACQRAYAEEILLRPHHQVAGAFARDRRQDGVRRRRRGQPRRFRLGARDRAAVGLVVAL